MQCVRFIPSMATNTPILAAVQSTSRPSTPPCAYAVTSTNTETKRYNLCESMREKRDVMLEKRRRANTEIDTEKKTHKSTSHRSA